MASICPLGILVEPSTGTPMNLSLIHICKDYLFAMNGQTGKLVGDLPVDKRKVAAWFAGISVPLMILLAILL